MSILLAHAWLYPTLELIFLYKMIRWHLRCKERGNTAGGVEMWWPATDSYGAILINLLNPEINAAKTQTHWAGVWPLQIVWPINNYSRYQKAGWSQLLEPREVWHLGGDGQALVSAKMIGQEGQNQEIAHCLSDRSGLWLVCSAGPRVLRAECMRGTWCDKNLASFVPLACIYSLN